MSFFGIDNNDLENGKRKYLEGTLDDDSDIPVYTWGTERYDGLGEVLQEGGDDLNDETFGGADPVGVSNSLCSLEATADAISSGKDFDFSQSAFFVDDAPAKPSALEPRQSAFDRDPLLDSRSQLTSECITCGSFIFYNFFFFHSTAISNFVGFAMGRPLCLLNVTACEWYRSVCDAWSTHAGPTGPATTSPIVFCQIFSFSGGGESPLRITPYLSCLTATTAPRIVHQPPTGCGADPRGG